MPDAIIRRQAADIVVQGSNGLAVQLSESQLQQIGRVTMAVIRETDAIYGQAEDYIVQGQKRRSAAHQQRLIERAALALAGFDRGAAGIQNRAIADILENRPQQVQVTRIVEVPQRGIIPRLFGA
jgi:hypothetical protein